MEETFAVKNQGLENFLIYWIKNVSLADQEALAVLREYRIPMIEPIEIIEEGDRTGFQYNIAYKATLRKYLMQPAGKAEVLKIFETCIEAFKFLETHKLERNHLVLNLDYVFVDFVTRELSFLYVPEKNFSFQQQEWEKSSSVKDENVRTFLKELLININYKEETDILYIAKLMLFLSKHQKLETEDLEKLVWNLKGTPSSYLKPLRMEEKKPIPVLMRTRNQEQIVIDKEIFRIGKSETDSDYVIEENEAISRLHAVICKKNGACYIKDHDSTNFTYVNGMILKGEKEQLLVKGTKISLADEEFVFDLI